jgi:hypothetical protein
MRTRDLVLGVIVLMLGAVLPGAASADVPQMNWEAAAVHNEIPTGDPCVVDFIQADVIDFLVPFLQDEAYIAVARTNICTGETIHASGTLGFAPIAESDFVVLGHGETGRLRLTTPLFDSVAQSEADASFDLRWDLKNGLPSDGEAVVTGRVTGTSFTTELLPSLTWNRWGSETFPWAGFWKCRFMPPNGEPGCIGQT